jgi:ribosomal-protein-alanine N-acetyltransferase
MIHRDIPQVMDIERHSYDVPWTTAELLSRLKRGNTIGLVVERQNRILGFAVYEVLPRELVLTTLAVSERCRKQGVGRSIIRHLVAKLRPERRRLGVIVSERNLSAQLFLSRCGLRAVHIHRDYYYPPSGDAVEFQHLWLGRRNNVV